VPIDLEMLSPPERAQLAGTLGVAVADLPEHLEAHANAAVEEYVRMFLGQRVYTRGSDIREYRLLLLIKHALGGRIPSEAEVSRLFQTTESQSRSLIRSVMSKFQYELREEIVQTLRETLSESGRESDEADYEVVIDSDNVVDELNRRIQAIDGTLPAIQKKRGTASTYVLRPSSHDRLIESLT
jgi:hypothetical protein